MKTDGLAKVLKALAHPLRLEIVKMLEKEPLCVCVINEKFGSTQPNISQHLKILKDAGILTSKKEGTLVIYSVKYEEVFEIIQKAEKIIKNEINNLGYKEV